MQGFFKFLQDYCYPKKDSLSTEYCREVDSKKCEQDHLALPCIAKEFVYSIYFTFCFFAIVRVDFSHYFTGVYSEPVDIIRPRPVLKEILNCL